MEIIQFKEANCKGCYKCIRNCEVKAIKFGNEQARIIKDQCILCGRCTIVCPQNAKVIKSDIPEIQQQLQNDDEIFVSLAPSYVAAFPHVTFSQISAAIKKLGFKHVEETAVGASMVSEEYKKLIAENKMKNIITSCCTTINLLIEKYYPELLPYLAPVISPLQAHAKAMKEVYGKDIKVCFIGPCISKKYEQSYDENIDTVLMFDELKMLFEQYEISLEDEDKNADEMKNTISRFYPVPAGIIKTIPSELRNNYKTFAVDGLDRCMDTLECLKNENIEGFFIEMNSCAGSCVQGPGLQEKASSLLTAKNFVISNVNKKGGNSPLKTETAKLSLPKNFIINLVKDKIPDEDTISSILASIGKTKPSDMLNCGACGYNSCREKAIAVFQGKADLKMCLPYMREKAESLSNLILENTPDAILVTEKEFCILEYNPAAEKMFNLIENTAIGLPLELFIHTEQFFDRIHNGENIYYEDTNDTNGKLNLSITIINAPNGDYIVIAKDITAERKKQEELEKIRNKTIETTQRVIDKQMRVAQEIASLLGETTGETKTAILNLQKSIIDNNIK